MNKPAPFPVRTVLCVALTSALLSLSTYAAGREPAAKTPVAKTAPSAAHHTARDPDQDDAMARKKWQAWWYNEAKNPNPNKVKVDRNQNGPWSVEYRRFMMEAANKEHAKWSAKMPEAGVKFADSDSWSNIGPTKADVAINGVVLHKTDSGRVASLIINPSNPQTIYAAFSGGGVWKTSDGGTTWAPKTETLGSLSVGALAMEPGHPNNLYLGLGDAFDGTGLGMVRSTDGGDHWSLPVYLGFSTRITSVVVGHTDHKVVMATTNYGVYRSADGGRHFALVSLPGLASPPVGWSMVWTGGSNFAVTIDDGVSGQVFTTADNGANWAASAGLTSAVGLGRMTLAAAPSSLNVVYALAAAKTPPSGREDLADIFKSTDGGQNWTALNVAAHDLKNPNREFQNIKTVMGGQSWYNQMIMVAPNNPDSFYVGGSLQMAKTWDGGQNFRVSSNWLGQFKLPYVHADFHAGTIGADGTILVGTDGGIFKSTDHGTTYTDAMNVGITSHLIYSVGSSLNNRNAVVGGFQDNGTRVRDADTSTFNQYIGGDGFGSAIHSGDAQKVLGSLYYARIYKSNNGGIDFNSASNGIVGAGDGNVSPFNTEINTWEGGDGNTVYTHSNTVMYKSTDFADSWTALGTTGLPSNIFIRGLGSAPSDANHIGMVTNGGRVFLSGDAGANWTLAAAAPNNGFSMSSIAFDPVNANTLYVTSVAANFATSHIWRSADNGASWTAIDVDGSGFPFGIPVNHVRVDHTTPTTIYAATHLGVYRSMDSGTTWTRYGNGMPLVNVTDVYVSSDSSLIRASTFGRGFWQYNP